MVKRSVLYLDGTIILPWKISHANEYHLLVSSIMN